MIRVRVPATSANCSIGFDTLGLALDWKSEITFDFAPSFLITGCPPEFAGRDNLVFTAFETVCQHFGREVPNLHIHIDSDIPFARGLGSSSQCVAAGIAGACALLDLDADDKKLLELATQLEGHPDNAAPALFGGLNICVSEGEDIVRVRLDAGRWKALAIIPPYEVSTPEARKALPREVGLHEAAMQTGRGMLFEYAWVHEDEELLCRSCVDCLHEPSRQSLIEDYDAMKKLSEKFRIPFWISGSGSTMLFVSTDEHRLEELQNEIRQSYQHLESKLCAVSDSGAEVIRG